MRWILTLFLFGSVAAVAQPVPSSPSNGETDVPTDTEFRWRTNRSDLYEVEIVNGITNVVHQTLFSESDRASASFLDYETRYIWRVRGVDSLGNAGSWSAVSIFTTIAQGSAPTLIQPPHSATDVEPDVTLVWQGATSASLFDVERDTLSDLSSATLVQVSTSSLPIQAGEGRTWYWRVREASIGAAPGPWSRTFSFSTRLPDVQPPSPPRLVAPQNGATEQPLTLMLDWMDVADAESYAVQIAPADMPDSIQLETSVGSSDLTVSLPPSTTGWRWMVRVTTSTGTSVWSAPWTFTTVVEADSSLERPRPLLPSPDAVIEAPSATEPATVHFSWWHDRADVTYVLQYAIDADLEDTAAVKLDVATPAVDVGGFPAGSSLRWRVLARTDWAESPWSPERSARIVAPATTEPRVMQLQTPPDQAVNVPVSTLFSWTPQDEAEIYVIQIAVDEQFQELAGGVVVTATQAVGDTLEEGRRYWWRGRAENSTGPGAWTAPFSFVTAGETTGILNEDPAGALTIQPNPATTTAQVSFGAPLAEASVLRIANAEGRIVGTADLQAGATTARIDVSALTAGRYTLLLPVAGRTIVSSIVILR